MLHKWVWKWRPSPSAVVAVAVVAAAGGVVGSALSSNAGRKKEAAPAPVGNVRRVVVEPGRQAKVGGLGWRVRRVTTADELPGQKPEGRFLIVNLEIHAYRAMGLPSAPVLRASTGAVFQADAGATASVGLYPSGVKLVPGPRSASATIVYDVTMSAIPHARLSLPNRHARAVELDLGLRNPVGQISSGRFRGATSQRLPIAIGVAAAKSSGETQARLTYFKVYVRGAHGAKCWIGGELRSGDAHRRAVSTSGSTVFKLSSPQGSRLVVIGQFTTSFDAAGHLSGQLGDPSCDARGITWRVQRAVRAPAFDGG
jgi:hypothetical protein